MPLLKTAAAARAGGMLGHEDGMVGHRSLTAVVFRFCRGEALFDEVSSVIEDHVESLAVQVLAFLRSQAKPAAKPRTAKTLKDVVEVIHRRASVFRSRAGLEEYR
jgi:hypothetical protein